MGKDPPDKSDKTDRGADEQNETTIGKNTTDIVSDDNGRTSSANTMRNDNGISPISNLPPPNDCNELIIEEQETDDNTTARGRRSGLTELDDYLLKLSNQTFTPKGEAIPRSHDCNIEGNMKGRAIENTDSVKYKKLCEKRRRSLSTQLENFQIKGKEFPTETPEENHDDAPERTDASSYVEFTKV